MSTSKIKEYTYQEAVELTKEGYIMEYYHPICNWTNFSIITLGIPDEYKNNIFRKKYMPRPNFKPEQELTMREAIIAFEMGYNVEYASTPDEMWMTAETIYDIVHQDNDMFRIAFED